MVFQSPQIWWCVYSSLLLKICSDWSVYDSPILTLAERSLRNQWILARKLILSLVYHFGGLRGFFLVKITLDELIEEYLMFLTESLKVFLVMIRTLSETLRPPTLPNTQTVLCLLCPLFNIHFNWLHYELATPHLPMDQLTNSNWVFKIFGFYPLVFGLSSGTRRGKADLMRPG